MRQRLLALATMGVLAAGTAACGTDSADRDSGGPGRVGVILPDTVTSARWATADPKFLRAAFDAAGIPVDIQNAEGDTKRFAAIADQMIEDGVRVLMIANLDSRSGRTALKKAAAKKIATIDYDRLTLNGDAQFYVSFDNVAVGQLQAKGLIKCLTDRGAQSPVVAELNGSPSDNNATLFKQGYDELLQPMYDSGAFEKGPDQFVPDWDNAEGGAIFKQMLEQTSNKIDGVLAANDGLGNAAIEVLREQKLNGRVPVTGQDATVQGLQNILAGDQCMTVYKEIKKEAEAAAALAIALAKGEKKVIENVVKDPLSGGDVPAVLLTPRLIYKEDVKDVVADGFVTREELCTEAYAQACKDAGIT